MKNNSRFNMFIRSAILSISIAVTCIFYCFICLLTFPFPLRLRYRVSRVWVGGMVEFCRVICHMDYKVEGWSNVKKVKTGIIMSKHSSAWETFFLTSRFDQVGIISKRELLWLPFFGWGLALLSPIAINRSNRKSAMQQIIEKGKAFLDAGRSILIFPEGTRVPFGTVGHYKMGGARLSAASGYPIIPVAHNAGYFWPRRQFTKKPGMIRIVFGPPIYPQGKTEAEILEETKSWIEAKVKELGPF